MCVTECLKAVRGLGLPHGWWRVTPSVRSERPVLVCRDHRDNLRRQLQQSEIYLDTSNMFESDPSGVDRYLWEDSSNKFMWERWMFCWLQPGDVICLEWAVQQQQRQQQQQQQRLRALPGSPMAQPVCLTCFHKCTDAQCLFNKGACARLCALAPGDGR